MRMNYLKLIQNLKQDLQENLNKFETVKFFKKFLLILKLFKWSRLTSNFGWGIFVQSTLKKSFWFIYLIFLIKLLIIFFLLIFFIDFFEINKHAEEDKILPSLSILRLFALRVDPVEVISVIISDWLVKG